MDAVEYVGIVAAVLILVSMCFPTNTFKATLLLRVFNLIGSIVFLIYGIMLPAIATAVLNGGNIVVNSVQIVLLFKKKNKDVEKKDAESNDLEVAGDNE